MSPDELDARIDAANEKMLTVEDTPQGGPLPRPVDTWQMYADARREYDRKSFPNGATKKYGMEAENALQALSGAYEKAKANIDSAMKRGDKMRAKLWRQQYMEENFMPAIDTLVLLGSADELLGMKDILKRFDEKTILDGVHGKGYTEALIRSLYDDQLGSTHARSDAIVKDAVAKASELANSGNIRAAVGLAGRTLQKVEAGENAADDYDYNLLQKIYLRGQ